MQPDYEKVPTVPAMFPHYRRFQEIRQIGQVRQISFGQSFAQLLLFLELTQLAQSDGGVKFRQRGFTSGPDSIVLPFTATASFVGDGG